MRRDREEQPPIVTVLGAGKFGHAIAEITSRNNIPTDLITRSASRAEQMRRKLTRRNPLLNVRKEGERPLAEYIFLALASQDIPSALGKIASGQLDHDHKFVLLSKGLTPPHGETPLELTSKIVDKDQVAVLSGPSLADELSKHGAHFAIASHSNELIGDVTEMIAGGNIVAHKSDDPTGVEWAGIAKNISTLGYHAHLAATGSRNLSGAYAALVFSDIWSYASTLGARPESFIGITGVGDLLTTSSAATSRNVRAGELIGKGLSAGEAEEKIQQTVESLHTITLLDARTGGTSPTIHALRQRVNGELAHENWVRSLQPEK